MAVFDLAKEGKEFDQLESNLDDLSAALAGSPELMDLIHSPVYSREEQSGAIAAVSAKMDLSKTMQNVLSLMASKRRLFVVPQMINRLRELIAEEKGEVTADVASAVKLTAAQSKELAKTLTAKIGKDVKINMTVDESLIGGLVVKVGSKMIDTSIQLQAQLPAKCYERGRINGYPSSRDFCDP